MSDFWQQNQVGGPYNTATESLKALSDRWLLFPNLSTLMPVEYPGKTVLDYGCGPGHDTVLFRLCRARHVYFTDISGFALRTTRARLNMHKLTIGTTEHDYLHPLPTVDHVHCAGVIHHTEDPLAELKRLRAALRVGGDARMMVYDGQVSEHSQSDVPITEWWTPDEFLQLAAQAGFDEGEHVGSYPCSAEWRPNCFAACFLLR